MENIQKRIFRNIQHEPRIWGITFGKVFGTLILSLVLVLLCQSFDAGGLITAIVGGGCAAVCYGLSFWLDNRDTTKKDQAPFVRSRLTVICMSNQSFIIREADDKI